MRILFEMEPNGSAQRLSSAPPVQLTPRQIEVLALLCQGLPNKQIGRQLKISADTVKIHVSGILRTLNVSSRLQAVIAARRLGLGGESAAARPTEREQSSPPGRPAESPIVWQGVSLPLLAATADQLLPEVVG